MIGLNLALVLSAWAAAPSRLVIPRRSDIVLLASEPQGAVNIAFECHVPIERERVLSFFSKGTKVYIPGVDIFEFQNRGHLTLPKKLPPEIQREVNKISRTSSGANLGALVDAEGALLTRNRDLYFWRLYSDRVLLLWQGADDKRVLIRED